MARQAALNLEVSLTGLGSKVGLRETMQKVPGEETGAAGMAGELVLQLHTDQQVLVRVCT